jgi:hypothetical protein
MAAMPKREIYISPDEVGKKTQGYGRSRAPTALKCVGQPKWRRLRKA